mmetsp:Transcript_61442/g.159539  ORF Transcript_61442/g.159539 Transcript_61442/m.159539 type:complete len:224 (+) Transcript_61442:157-828(+)
MCNSDDRPRSGTAQVARLALEDTWGEEERVRPLLAVAEHALEQLLTFAVLRAAAAQQVVELGTPGIFLLHCLDDRRQVVDAAVPVREVDELAVRRRSRQPLDHGLQLRVPAEDPAAPVASGEGLAAHAGALLEIPQARRVRLREFSKHEGGLVLAAPGEFERIQGDDVRPQPLLPVRWAASLGGARAGKCEAPAVPAVIAVLLRPHDGDRLLGAHPLTEQQAH